jgi:hypothetical protein
MPCKWLAATRSGACVPELQNALRCASRLTIAYRRTLHDIVSSTDYERTIVSRQFLLLSFILLMNFTNMIVVAAPAPNPTDLAALCTKYETVITAKIASANPAEAIVLSAEYDRALRALEAPPTFANGRFESAAHLMEFTAPFARDWKRSARLDDKEVAALTAMGIDVLAKMEGTGGEERLVVMSLDADMLLRRMGFDSAEQQKPSWFRTTARGMIARFGRIENERVIPSRPKKF